MQIAEVSFVPFQILAVGGDLPSWLRVIAGACENKAFSCQIRLSTKENIFGVVFKLRRPPANHQGTGSKRQPEPPVPSI